MSVLKKVKYRELRKAGTNSRCPFYRGVRLLEVSVKRGSTVFLVAYCLIKPGYFLGLPKSILMPRKIVPYMGFLSDSSRDVCHLIPEKKEKFLDLIDHLALNSLSQMPPVFGGQMCVISTGGSGSTWERFCLLGR